MTVFFGIVIIIKMLKPMINANSTETILNTNNVVWARIRYLVNKNEDEYEISTFDMLSKKQPSFIKTMWAWIDNVFSWWSNETQIQFSMLQK